MQKILFITKMRSNEYGYLNSSGLRNSVVMLMQALGIAGFNVDFVDVVDSNDIDREVFKRKPDIVIIEAFWVTPEKLKELCSLHHHKHRQWIIRCHSKVPFLASEGIGLPWMIKYLELGKTFPIKIGCNAREACEALQTAFREPFLYLPNIYHVHNKHYARNLPLLPGDDVHIGCFGALRLLKNQVAQALAALAWSKEYGMRLHFHINVGRVEGPQADIVLKSLRAIFNSPYSGEAELVEHGWLDHQDFLQLMETMDICMQVSFTETFNIVAADAVHCGLPILGSPDIEWLPSEHTVEPTKGVDIQRGLSKILFEYRDGIMSRKNKEALARHNHESLQEWCEFLTQED